MEENNSSDTPLYSRFEEGKKAQGRLLLDIFGNPFQPTPVFDPSLLTWSNDVKLLAQAAYDERKLPSGELNQATLAILGDVLEEAGCTEAMLLEHLRKPGTHVRGCWALDLILGKN
jgi:hypothetical protein